MNLSKRIARLSPEQRAILARRLEKLAPDPSAEKRLVAYFVTSDGAPVNVEELRDHLRAKLPDYMMPAAFVRMNHLPLTPNGKVDREALPAPLAEEPEVKSGYEAPRTPIEQKLAEIWSAVLRVERIGLRENFFEAGGHSLLAIQAMAKVRESFDIELPLRVMFEAPTIAALSEQIFERLLARGQQGEVNQTLAELEKMSDEDARRLFSSGGS